MSANLAVTHNNILGRANLLVISEISLVRGQSLQGGKDLFQYEITMLVIATKYLWRITSPLSNYISIVNLEFSAVINYCSPISQ